jgi:hypothetical protein
LSSSVPGCTAEALERDEASCGGPRLSTRLVGAPVFAVLLLAISPEHRVEHLGVVAVGLHLHLGLHSRLVADGVAARVDVLGTLRIMILILIDKIEVQVLVIIHVHIVHRAVPALDQCRLLRHGESAWRMLVLVRKVHVLLPQHEGLCLRLLRHLRLVDHRLLSPLLLHLYFLLCISPIHGHKRIADGWIAYRRLLLVELLSMHAVLDRMLRKRLTLSAHCVVLHGAGVAGLVSRSSARSSCQIH